MNAEEALQKGYSVNTTCNCEKQQGYEVTYPDGYKSWCPKEVADKAYFHIQDSNGEVIYHNDIENFIANVDSMKIGTKTTNTTITTITGFELHGQSSCVKPENYDIKIGQQYAIEKAKDQLWFALGFVLQWARNGLNQLK